ncbi:DNA-binding NarL/FixJ family response regulator [Saccharothrix saharensis]|uniref:DNA-binding NarL/FixJ family response regulator n=1 Tax=Saccharothrix saharensis TaxID=571190 RepID=A0A543JFH0_9PSEU|nr:response regulator transcription factor [Saccharothrix saharensis]TQM81562.1 DNA-binding NarL/FixJ family response regulator [Saccharothrix saharensis]
MRIALAFGAVKRGDRMFRDVPAHRTGKDGAATVGVVLGISDPVPLAGLVSVLKSASGVRVVGTADTVPAVERLIRVERPEVAVLDISMGEPLDLLRRVVELRGQHAGTVFTLFTSDAPSSELLSAANAAGVRSFLSNRDVASDVIGVVRSPLRLAVGGRVPEPSLTPRESDVLPLVADGWTDREIGERLRLAERSVKFHISNMLAKFNARNRAHLVYLSYRTRSFDLSR